MFRLTNEVSVFQEVRRTLLYPICSKKFPSLYHIHQAFKGMHPRPNFRSLGMDLLGDGDESLPIYKNISKII
jgi:hypothetical protein